MHQPVIDDSIQPLLHPGSRVLGPEVIQNQKRDVKKHVKSGLICRSPLAEPLPQLVKQKRHIRIPGQFSPGQPAPADGHGQVSFPAVDIAHQCEPFRPGLFLSHSQSSLVSLVKLRGSPEVLESHTLGGLGQFTPAKRMLLALYLSGSADTLAIYQSRIIWLPTSEGMYKVRILTQVALVRRFFLSRVVPGSGG